MATMWQRLDPQPAGLGFEDPTKRPPMRQLEQKEWMLMCDQLLVAKDERMQVLLIPPAHGRPKHGTDLIVTAEWSCRLQVAARHVGDGGWGVCVWVGRGWAGRAKCAYQRPAGFGDEHRAEGVRMHGPGG